MLFTSPPHCPFLFFVVPADSVVVGGVQLKSQASPKNGLQPFVACDERRWWTQIIKKGTTCEGSNMELSTRFWAVSGGEYCVGTSQATASRPAFSRVLRLVLGSTGLFRMFDGTLPRHKRPSAQSSYSSLGVVVLEGWCFFPTRPPLLVTLSSFFGGPPDFASMATDRCVPA